MFTKEEKHEFYKKMLSKYKQQIKQDDNHGFCSIIYIITPILSHEIIPFISLNLPELYAYKPKQKGHGMYWFPTHITRIRIKILEECIEKTA